jgi:hypothetical protein
MYVNIKLKVLETVSHSSLFHQININSAIFQLILIASSLHFRRVNKLQTGYRASFYFSPDLSGVTFASQRNTGRTENLTTWWKITVHNMQSVFFSLPHVHICDLKYFLHM